MSSNGTSYLAPNWRFRADSGNVSSAGNPLAVRSERGIQQAVTNTMAAGSGASAPLEEGPGAAKNANLLSGRLVAEERKKGARGPTLRAEAKLRTHTSAAPS